MLKLPDVDGFTFTTQIVPDSYPDVSHLEPNNGNYVGESPEDIAKYEAQDAERLAAHRRGEWDMCGVIVECSRAGVVLGRDSVWGLESDSGDAFFQEVARERALEALAYARTRLAELNSAAPAAD